MLFLFWVHELRAQVEKERRLVDLEEVRIKERWEELKKENEKREKDEEKVEKERPLPPWKRARSSLSPASLSPALPPEEGIEEEPKPEQLENKEEGWQSLSSYSEDAEEEAAPKPVDHMAFLSLGMKAILGYTNLNWPSPSGNLSVGGMLLKNLRIGLCLCGIEELQRLPWMLQTSGHWVTVQCGHGKWAKHLTSGPNYHFDLHKWSNYEGPSGGHIPLPDASTVHKATSFSLLNKDFEAVWTAVEQLPESSLSGHRMLILFCKSRPASVLCTPDRAPDVEFSCPRA